MPVCYKIESKKVRNMEDFAASLYTTYDNLFISFTEKEYITPADYCFVLPSHST